jgi:hypothetical protein
MQHSSTDLSSNDRSSSALPIEAVDNEEQLRTSSPPVYTNALGCAGDWAPEVRESGRDRGLEEQTGGQIGLRVEQRV